MPVFDNPDQAREYILRQLDNGMICEQRFMVEGIEVTCRLNTGAFQPVPVRKLAVPAAPRPVEQRTFPHEQRIELPHELRDYQMQAVDFAIAHRHAIIELPTGRGKTLVAIGIVNDIMRREPVSVLVVVPTQILLHQWIEDGFQAAGISASGVSGESKSWGEHTVITYQSALNYLHMLSRYNIIIFDEVHHLFSPEYRKILFAVENKPYLIGLTATVRQYGEEKKLQDSYFPNVFRRTLEEFQAGQERIPVSVEMIPVNFTASEMAEYNRLQDVITRANRAFGPVPEWMKYMHSDNDADARLARAAISAYAAQKRLLTETPAKLDSILEIIRQSSGQFIVFSDTIDGIQSIEDVLRRAGVSEGSIYSGVKPSERARIISGLKDRSIRVLVGGSAITEGLDLPDISNAILSSLLVKSSRTYVQRVGRILRPSPGKTVRLYLVYVSGTLEQANARRVRDLMGESGNGIFD